MIVDGEKVFLVNTEGNSVFEIPVASFDTALDVIADTVAMRESRMRLNIRLLLILLQSRRQSDEKRKLTCRLCADRYVNVIFWV